MAGPVVLTLRCGEGVQLGDVRLMICALDGDGIEVHRFGPASQSVFSLSGFVQLGVSAGRGEHVGRVGVTVKEVRAGRARIVFDAPQWCEVSRVGRGDDERG
jgi:sRNA-binding carbon storage regulator CsrA